MLGSEAGMLPMEPERVVRRGRVAPGDMFCLDLEGRRIVPADEVREQAPGLDALYAVHGIDGERLALVRDRHMAFMLARQNELNPVSVH